MDFALPPAFERFPRHRAKAEAACRTALADPDVVGMAVTGSFATGNADEVSDVDLRVYARSGAVRNGGHARAGAGVDLAC
jgi:predicted nucleotidyltransferase